jgi:hypothetical protein
VNAILPALISDFEAVRDQVAELFMRQIREHDPDFNVKECDRQAAAPCEFRRRGMQAERWFYFVSNNVWTLFFAPRRELIREMI